MPPRPGLLSVFEWGKHARHVLWLILCGSGLFMETARSQGPYYTHNFPDEDPIEISAEGGVVYHTSHSADAPPIEPVYPPGMIPGETVGWRFDGNFGAQSYRATISGSYPRNWRPNELTAATEVGAFGANGDTRQVKQLGLDNRYVFTVTGEFADEANQILAADAEGAGIMLSAPHVIYPISIFENTDWVTGLMDFGGYFVIGLEPNYKADQVTQPRSTTIQIAGTDISINQAGIDNRYEVTISENYITVRTRVYGSPVEIEISPGDNWISIPDDTDDGMPTPATFYATTLEFDGNERFFVAKIYYIRKPGMISDEFVVSNRHGNILVAGTPYPVDSVYGRGVEIQQVKLLDPIQSVVSVAYRLGDQAAVNQVSFFYSTDKKSYTRVFPLGEPLYGIQPTLNGLPGSFGNGVAPGLHSLTWDAAAIYQAAVERKVLIYLRISDELGYYDISEPIDLAGSCGACSSCSMPGSQQCGVGSLRASVSLGADAQGRSYGEMFIHEERPTLELSTPASLSRMVVNGARTYPTGTENYTQIKTPTSL